jgi:hypothetical protein
MILTRNLWVQKVEKLVVPQEPDHSHLRDELKSREMPLFKGGTRLDQSEE